MEILCMIDALCREHGIVYSLYGGSLLGAVRHQDFIPWDDDLDICMSRENYNKFLKIWDETAPKGFFLQNKNNSPYFTQTFSKIRKEHTTFLQYDWERGKYHTGIFVDVFPIDRMPSGRIKRLLFQWDCLRYPLLTREFVPPTGNSIVKAVSALLLLLSPKKLRPAMRERLLNRITRVNDPDANMVSTEMLSTVFQPLPPDLLDSFEQMHFGAHTFPCMTAWKEYLELYYGDYMSLPPEPERTWTHHPIILDFEHNLEELPNE